MPPRIYPKVFLIEWKNLPNNLESGAVYRIWFGKKYYIGRSRCIKQRRQCHEADICRRLAGKLPSCDPALDYYRKVTDYLVAHPRIRKGYFEILLLSDDDSALVAGEQEWFDKTINDKNCLNLGRIAAPYKYERKPKPEKKRIPKKIKKVKSKPPSLTNKQKIRSLKRLLSRIEKGLK